MHGNNKKVLHMKDITLLSKCAMFTLTYIINKSQSVFIIFYLYSSHYSA